MKIIHSFFFLEFVKDTKKQIIARIILLKILNDSLKYFAYKKLKRMIPTKYKIIVL